MAPESWFSIYFLLFFDVGSTFFTYRIFIYGILYLYTKKSGNNCFQISPRGANQIWTGDRGVADLCLTTWLCRHTWNIIPQKNNEHIIFLNINGKKATTVVVSLYIVKSEQRSLIDYNSHIQNFIQKHYLTRTLWSSLRSISNSQLHVSLHFHLCPIYLVLFKGSYVFKRRDISSWRGLHA